MADAGDSELMNGKRGLVVGVANDHSIAWGIAQALAGAGAELAFTYQDEALKKRVEPLAGSAGSDIVLPCDVEDVASVDAVFDQLATRWGTLDFLVHAVAFSDKNELRGRYIDTSRENFLRTLHISCFSFTDLARRCAAMMPDGGSLLTLTYLGAQRVMPSYNVMGVAKAALEASVRYLAADLVQADVAPERSMLAVVAVDEAGVADRGPGQGAHRPGRDRVDADPALTQVGGSGLYLLSDLASGVTGEVMHVDAGFNVVGIPKPNGNNNAG